MTSEAEFKTRLRREGFTEVVAGEMTPNEHRDSHAHDYDVLGLVLRGDITLTCGGAARTYRAGDDFAMAAGIPHVEDVGADGVRYLAGRRRK
jgi:quercetin dioxygenase-like cupin family protein